ncbi:MAG: hypothetical protein Q7S34_01565 [bacterium]|nr:hypothetical protein [bacterium]
MKYFELSKEEKQISKDYDKGLFKKSPKSELIRFRSYAKNTLGKTRSINIRLSERDVRKIKTMAVKKGMPYQTLISSLIHQL